MNRDLDSLNKKLLEGPIKGYKAVDENLMGHGTQFKIGELCTLDNQRRLVPTVNGFHFVRELDETWAKCYGEGTRMFEVKAFDVLDYSLNDTTMVCRKITLVKEIKRKAS